MQTIKEGKWTIPALRKDAVLPPLAIRITIKTMRLIFIAKMLQCSFLPFSPFNLLNFDNSISVSWFITYSVIVSIWGFAVWIEGAYRNKINLQLPRCTKIKCSRYNTRIKSPKWFNCKNWMHFFLLYLFLTASNLIVQLAYFSKEMCSQGINVPGTKKPGNRVYLSVIILMGNGW